MRFTSRRQILSDRLLFLDDLPTIYTLNLADLSISDTALSFTLILRAP